MPELYRVTGIDAAGRVARLLARGGVDAVLGEVELIASDVVAATYLTELLRQADPDPRELERLLATAGRSIASDHGLATLLVTVVDTAGADIAALPGFLAACETVGSDHDRHRVLVAVAQGASGEEPLEQALRCAAGIGSDHDLAQVLLAVAARWPPGEPLPPRYFAVARAIGSDHDLARTLRAVASRRPLVAPDARAILALADAIESDYDLAEVLVAVAATGAIQGPLVAEYRAAAGFIAGDHDRARVLEALTTGLAGAR